MIISDESYERVRDAVADIKCCCETEDDYMEWEDIASFSIMAFLEALDEDQLKMTLLLSRNMPGILSTRTAIYHRES